MWKTGVVERGLRMDRELSRPSSRRFALTLLVDLQSSYTPEDEPLLARIYSQLVVGGDVYKTTRRKRFVELDSRLVEDLAWRFAGARTVMVHDVGASNGVSSLVLLRALRTRIHARVHATDLYDRLYLVKCNRSSWVVTFTADREPVQFVGRHFVLPALERESRRRPLNVLLRWWLRRNLLPSARLVLETTVLSSTDEEANGPLGRVLRVPLIHPECLQVLGRDPDFTFARHDLFVPTEERYHVIRAVNVLNPGYFSNERLGQAIRALATGLRPGGLLLVGRTVDEEDGHTRATAFVKMPGRFQLAWELHEGAENRDFIARLAV